MPRHWIRAVKRIVSRPHTAAAEGVAWAAAARAVAMGRAKNTVAKLPADDHRDEILARVRENRVTIIQGETGCGKTTLANAIAGTAAGALALQRVSRFKALRGQ